MHSRMGDYELHLPKLGQRPMYRHMWLERKSLLVIKNLDENALVTCDNGTAADFVNIVPHLDSSSLCAILIRVG